MKYLLIAIAAATLFVPFLGHVHLFDWDEINFAEAAREMLVTHNYSQVQIDFAPFWEKPPLFIWMQAFSMVIFGVNEFAARFPNAIIGIATLVTLFSIGKKLADEKLGLWWALAYAGSWLPHFYFKSGIIDPTFNYFIFLAIYCVFRVPYAAKPNRMAILGGIALGLAVLTKGPVAILVSLLSFVVYWVVKKGKTGIRLPQLGLITLLAFITAALWFGYQILTRGWWFVNEFVTYQVRLLTTPDAGHGGNFFYHWIVLLIGCFPASIFLFSYFRSRKERSIYSGAQGAEIRDFRIWMWVLFWVALIMFSIVETKIVHYSSLCYFPLSFLAAWQIYRVAEGKVVLRAWNIVLMLLVGMLIATAITLLPVVGVYKAQLIAAIGDRFAKANLQADVPFSLWESAYGAVYLLLVIVSAVLLFNKKVKVGMVTLFVSTICAIQITVVHFTPKIEGFSQRAAIEFFESFQGKDDYVQVLSYHSYAHLFYTKKMPAANKNYYNQEWLLNGPVDKPTYFICRVTDSGPWRANPNLEVIGEKNGFVFFKRK
ncbi:ArnT family glycosyltransferase [Chitinophaga sancti]|uniref:4-amino-4-deoxy-L-arabinose transferase n=1 Tax=Chitinophaga sancti TaxID=1004 RepID=A0A1K1SR31_9BACT|nr:glycosyltransferase family 39 protein [Chitinophaga sancti]WQD61025.1 glycosyltransferase family 39 protein [Chitinophaga sancti]WQG86846.1 glycosyltransferase family 39 protein [Chitinophaga sancti]SFW86535.1 4-amino-4-deoxy-L-arabinose transferase [Chitinophaga sancti]